MRPLAFAEDLDFGLRALQAGLRLAYLPSVAVIHSHRRSPAYHLHRFFVDWLAQVDMLGFATHDWSRDGIRSAGEMVAALTAGYGAVSAIIASLGDVGPVATLEERLIDALLSPTLQPNPPSEESLSAILTSLAAAIGHSLAGEARPHGGHVRERYGGLLRDFLAFAGNYADLSDRAYDLRQSLSSLYAQLAGWCLADFVRWSQGSVHRDPGVAIIEARFSGGV